MTPPTRRVEVAIAADVSLQQWARQTNAPEGAAVVAHHEIAARRRRGLEWRVEDAVAVSVLARPSMLDPASSDVVWAAASQAAARATEDQFGCKCSCLWPDQVLCDDAEASTSSDASGFEVSVTTTCALGPGRIDFALLTVRAGPVRDTNARALYVDHLIQRLRQSAADLVEPESVIGDYQSRCVTLSKPVELRLLPHGTMRGIATSIDRGRLVVTSPTGLQEKINVANINTVTLLPHT